MSTELDTLKKFGNEFQHKCVAGLLVDRNFLERILDILSPDYFESTSHKWIVEKTIEYFLKYKNIPTPNVFVVLLKEIDSKLQLYKQSIADSLQIVYDHLYDSDLNFVKEQFLEFCKNQKLKGAIVQSVDFLKRGEYESIKNVVDNALRAGMERNLGHDYIEDVDSRMSTVARECIKTNWALIDQLLDGGLGRGELGFIVACAGAGKSWVLARLGAEAMKQGKNVLHVTLELNEHYVGLRYDACFTGIAFQDIRNKIDVVKNKINKIPGKLFIKYFPLKTVSPQNIKLFIERLEMLHQIKIDLLVVDYADILRPFMAERNSNSYTEAGSVYEELRSVAGELQIPIWSASQSNRCFSLETIVSEEVMGDIEVRDLKVGNCILTHSGYKKVSHIFPIKSQPVYKIKLKSGKEIKCSANHRFPTQYGKVQSIESGLSVGDKLFSKK